MKSLLSFLFLATVFLLTGCGSSSSDSDAQTIGVCMSTFNSPCASAAVREFKRYADEKGVDLILLDSQQDIQRESSNIQTLLARGVDAILA